MSRRCTELPSLPRRNLFHGVPESRSRLEARQDRQERAVLIVIFVVCALAALVMSAQVLTRV